MVIDITGVIEQGGRRSANVSPNARESLAIPRATDVTVRLRVLSSFGDGIDLAGATARLVVKKRSGDSTIVVDLTGVLQPVDGINRANFTFVPATTSGLVAGPYVFSCIVVRAGLTDTVIPLSSFLLEPTLL